LKTDLPIPPFRNYSSFDGHTKNAVDKLLFGDYGNDATYDVPEGRELRRTRTFEGFIFGSQPSSRPSPRPSPGAGNRAHKINLLSRPSPEMKARKMKISKSEENLDWEDEDKVEKGRKMSENKIEKGRKFSENKVETVQKFEKNESGVLKAENFYQKAPQNETKVVPKAERKFDKQSRPKTTSAFLFDLQRKVSDQRLENRTKRNPRPRPGPMTRAKSLSQLRDSPQPKHLGKTISTNFELEEFDSESAELLESNPRLAVQRKETRL